MTTDHRFQCQCGAFQARVAQPAAAVRLACYCRDCQAFAHFLNLPAHMLDAQGGTELVAASPAQLHIERGAEQLQVMMLSAQGSYRWYTRCCRTPVAVAPRQLSMGHVSLPSAALALGSGMPAVAAHFGPLRARANRQGAHGTPPPPGPVRSALALGRYVLRLLGRMLASAAGRNAWRGSPLVDLNTQRPRAPIEVLPPEQRQALLDRAGQAPVPPPA